MLKLKHKFIYIFIYICTQEVIIYKLAANFWSPALPQRAEACATRLLLLLTVAKEFLSQSIGIVPYCNMESFICLVKSNIQITCVKHIFCHPVFFSL